MAGLPSPALFLPEIRNFPITKKPRRAGLRISISIRSIALAMLKLEIHEIIHWPYVRPNRRYFTIFNLVYTAAAMMTTVNATAMTTTVDAAMMMTAAVTTKANSI
ncbi:hypothetical protein BA060_03035 [Brucella sp. B13-0095]|nr:hypothetical protein BA060_03035 [Brucella sp. B13-0095]